MKTVEELKAQITAALQSETSEQKLARALTILEGPELPMLTDQEEAALARGMADWEAGRSLTHEQVLERLKTRRGRNAGQRHAS